MDLHGEELYFVTWNERDSNYGIPLKILRHVQVLTDPAMDWRLCYEVKLPGGKKRLYLDPEVSGNASVLPKAEADLLTFTRNSFPPVRS